MMCVSQKKLKCPQLAYTDAAVGATMLCSIALYAGPYLKHSYPSTLALQAEATEETNEKIQILFRTS